MIDRGIVVAFDEYVGLGKVQSIRGETYLFHCTQIADGSRTIAVGTNVEFTVIPRHHNTYEASELTPV